MNKPYEHPNGYFIQKSKDATLAGKNPGKKPKCAFHVALYINMPLEFVKIALLTEVLDRFNPNNTKKLEKLDVSDEFSENNGAKNYPKGVKLYDS